MGALWTRPAFRPYFEPPGNTASAAAPTALPAMWAVPIAASAASPTAPAPTLTAVPVTLTAAPATAHPPRATVQANPTADQAESEGRAGAVHQRLACLGSHPATVQHVDARIRLLVRMAGGQHHAFGNAELHLARRQVGDQHGELADQLFGLVGRGDAGEDVARLPSPASSVRRSSLVEPSTFSAVHDLRDAQVDLGEVVDGDARARCLRRRAVLSLRQRVRRPAPAARTARRAASASTRCIRCL